MDIESVLPHRYPFLFVDRIVACEPGKRAIGVKNVTRNEWFFSGHFPGEPIMPGVLITEAIAQMSAFALSVPAVNDPAVQERKAAVGMIASIKGIKFIAPVVPGDQLELLFEVISARGPYVKGRGEASVDGRVVTVIEEMVIVAQAAKQEAVYASAAHYE